MSRRTKYTQEDLDKVRAAYEAWNPYDRDAESAAELAERFDMSKATLYTWRRKGFRLDGREGDGDAGWKPKIGEGSESEAIRYLADQLVIAKLENEELQRQLQERIAELEEAVEQIPE